MRSFSSEDIIKCYVKLGGNASPSDRFGAAFSCYSHHDGEIRSNIVGKIELPYPRGRSEG